MPSSRTDTMCIICVYVLCIMYNVCVYVYMMYILHIYIYMYSIYILCVSQNMYRPISGTAEEEMGRNDTTRSEVSQIEERRYCRQKQMEKKDEYS